MRYFHCTARYLSSAAVVASAIFVSLAAPAIAAKFDSSQLTVGGLTGSNAQVSGWGVTWYGADGEAGGSNEVFYYDGLTTQQLTNNVFTDQNPVISGNRVAWWAQVGGIVSTRQIFLYDGSTDTITPLTADGLRNELPKISSDYVVWQRGAGANQEIMVYDGVTTIGMGVGAQFNISGPSTSGQYVTWSQSGGLGNQIKLYDGVSTTTVGESSSATNWPVVSATGQVAWEGFINSNIDQSGREIFYRDGAAPIVNLSNNALPDFRPQISGDDVVWWGGFAPNRDIFGRYNGVIGPISSSLLTDSGPQISNGKVVWIGDDGVDDQIYYYDGVMITKLTSGVGDKLAPQISGSHVVWHSASEVYQALVYPTGDEDKNGVVDIGDITLLAEHWLETGPVGDVNNSGRVDIADLTLIADQWLQKLDMPPAPVPPPIIVPEPATAVSLLVGVAILAIGACRRRSTARAR